MSDDFGLWEVIASMFWFMLLFAWIWLLITILADIFRDHELGGWGKAMWTLFIVFLPWLGALSYLVARGKSMNERTKRAAMEREESKRAYIQDVAAPQSTADELYKLADLRDKGVITTSDFDAAKIRMIG